jgi:hypothetical protein
MGNNYGPKIVTDGLIFCGDPNAAGNDDGADGANGMMNLVDNARNVKSGSPTVATLGGVVCWKFNSTGQYYESDIIATADQPTINATVEAWIYPQAAVVGTDMGCVLRLNSTNSLYHSWNKSSRKLNSYWYNHSTQGSSGYHATGAAMALDTWHHTCAVWNYSDAKIYQYTNMTKTSAVTQGNNISGGYVEMGMENSDRQYTGGIGVMRIYNIALTDTQVEQNFNALRTRYGL